MSGVWGVVLFGFFVVLVSIPADTVVAYEPAFLPVAP
jgi:hypothetical protein